MGKIIQFAGQHVAVRNGQDVHENARAQNLELFPLDVIGIDPVKKGEDSAGTVLAADGYPYNTKSARTRPELPLNEWLCYHLSEACGIAVPTNKILKMPDGELVFGSRQAGGTYTKGGIVNTPDQLVRRLVVRERLWGILALDLFIQNFDRRFANLVFQTVGSETNVLSIDFSRAFLHHQNLFSPISSFDHSCNTLAFARFVSGIVPFSFQEIERICSALNRVTVDHLLDWAGRAPAAWRSVASFNDLLDWWESEHKKTRLQEIQDYFWNGTYI